jgi:hypothetical protein
MTIFLYLNVFAVLFVDLCLGLEHYCSQLEVLYTLLVFTPLFSLSCMSRPTKNSVMKRHVLSPKYLQHLDFALFQVKSNLAKIFLTTALLYSVRALYLAEAIGRFREVHNAHYRRAFDDPHNVKTNGNLIARLCYGNWNHLQNTHTYWEETLEMEHKFNFCLLLVMLGYWSIGLESSKSTLFSEFTGNAIFKVTLCL